MRANLESRIIEQEEQIQALNKELAAKNQEIQTLNKNLSEQKNINKQKDAQILKIEDEKFTAYFAVGTKTELLAKNLIDRKGGFLWIGRSSVVANNANFVILLMCVGITLYVVKVVAFTPISSANLP